MRPGLGHHPQLTKRPPPVAARTANVQGDGPHRCSLPNLDPGPQRSRTTHVLPSPRSPRSPLGSHGFGGARCCEESASCQQPELAPQKSPPATPDPQAGEGTSPRCPTGPSSWASCPRPPVTDTTAQAGRSTSGGQGASLPARPPSPRATVPSARALRTEGHVSWEATQVNSPTETF